MTDPTKLETPCRVWRGAKNSKGYGWFSKHRMLLHRWVWEQVNGPIPRGMIVLHRCDNPPCFRLDHLRLGTHAQNTADMMAKGRGGHGPTPSGSSHWRAVLTVDDVALIRSSPESAAALARRLGVSTSTVKRVRRGESYV